ncbi:uncharacterized protein LOC115210817 [Argonauta hians]
MEKLRKSTLLVVFGLVLAVVCSHASTTVPLSQPNQVDNEVIDIDEPHDNLHDISSDGSGDSDNEEDEVEEEGSGNETGGIDDVTGSGTIETAKVHTIEEKPKETVLSACQKHQRRNRKQSEKYIPQCSDSGEYQKMQCQGRWCWCVYQDGTIIQGTKLASDKPDCNKGSGFGSCTRKLVKHSHSGLLGSFRPNCSESGEYAAVQCSGSRCWCADKHGEEIKGTYVTLPKSPDCDVKPRRNLVPVVPKQPNVTTTKPVVTVKVLLPQEPEGTAAKESTSSVTASTISTVVSSEISTASSDSRMYEPKPNESATEEPGIMAAIIAGAVVGLFVCILLTMFIVYRMRKKDEGSYPLDEPCKSNYSYTKAPDKEFYA